MAAYADAGRLLPARRSKQAISWHRLRPQDLPLRVRPKVRNRRRDFHHKSARSLVNTCDVMALEQLNIAGMTRRPAPEPDPDRPGAFLPNWATAKAGLNKSILDAGWAQFANILTGKAEEAGRRVVFVNPAGTSTGCHQCGRTCARPKQDTVICPVHGPMDADLNRYDLYHITTDHPTMTRAEWAHAYEMAWKNYYTDEHVETILKRAVATGASAGNTLFLVGAVGAIVGTIVSIVAYRGVFRG